MPRRPHLAGRASPAAPRRPHLDTGVGTVN